MPSANAFPLVSDRFPEYSQRNFRLERLERVVQALIDTPIREDLVRQLAELRASLARQERTIATLAARVASRG
jgi:hypothetical protein